MKATIEDVVHSVPFKTKEGEDRVRHTKIGTLFTNEKGQKSIKMEYMPLDIHNGFINVYPRDTQNNSE